MTHSLSPLFSPSSIAVFGASEHSRSLAGVVFDNILKNGFKGPVYAVNPKHQSIFGRHCYNSLEDIEADVELAIIATPAATIEGIIRQCGERGVKAAVILSAGFRDAGQEGERLEEEVMATAQKFGIRFIGPNSLGFIRPPHNLHAAFFNGNVPTGNLALISQSAAVCTAILDWADARDIGFSAVVSIGVSIDISFGEILDYLIADTKTHSILLYIEGVRDARPFMSGLRAAARVKPVIIIKAGRHQTTIEATKNHTGAPSGCDDVFSAALRRAGVVRGRQIGDLFAAATILASGIKLKGERLAMVTNGGGPAAMACDRASDLHIPLARLQPETLEKLDQQLPAIWSHMNPVDILGDADPKRYEQAVTTVMEDSEVDGTLVLLTPQATTDADAIAQTMIAVAKKHKKPLLTCWMGDTQVVNGRHKMNEAGVPSFRLPENAIQGFSFLSKFYRNQKLLLETPGPLAHADKPDIKGAKAIVRQVLNTHRTHLTGIEAKALLAAFNIPISPAIEVKTSIEAVVAAASIGFPVAMKVKARDLPATDVEGGIRLNISSSAAVQAIFTELTSVLVQRHPEIDIEGVIIEPMASIPNAWMLAIGISQDEVFGPAITLRVGGSASSSREVALPPLNRVLAQELIARTPFADLPQWQNIPPVEDVLMRVSEIACELPEVLSLQIDPLLTDGRRATAVDVAIQVSEINVSDRPYMHTAIHPYPSHLSFDITLHDGTPCHIRAIRPEDAELVRLFTEGLSDSTKRYRFMNVFRKLPRDMLARFTQIDYDREMALIALVQEGNTEVQIGSVRYTITPEGNDCEFAIAIADDWQGKGLAQPLMTAIIDYARQRGLKTMSGEVLTDNRKMLGFMLKLGFSRCPCPDDPSVTQIHKTL